MTISRVYSKVIMRKLCSNQWKIVWIPGIPLLGEAGRLGKIVWQINFRVSRGFTNSYRSAGYVERYNLRESNYILLQGTLEEEGE